MGFGLKRLLKDLLGQLGYEVLRTNRPAGNDLSRDAELLDVYLKPAISGGRKLKIVQVGANDGYTGDPLVEILQSDNVEAILIEPLPDLGQALRERHADNPRVRIEIAAISDRPETLDLFVARRAEDGKISDSTISSFDRAHVAQHIADRKDVEPEIFGGNPRIDQVTVQCRTVAQILERAGWSEADVLVVDTEGYDAVIINNVLNSQDAFGMIYFEHVNVPMTDYQALSERLDEAGYALVMSGMNTLAIKPAFLDVSPAA